MGTLMLLTALVNAEEASDQAKQESKRHFKQGDAYVQAGAYKSAVEEFLAAYQLFPNERFHYSIAQAYRLQGDKQKAVEHYKKYLASVSDGETAEDARQQLATLMTDIEKEDAARAAKEAEAQRAAEAKAAADKAVVEKAATEKAAAEKTAAESAKRSDRPELTSPPPTRKKPYWIAGLVAGVVVVAAVGIGLGVGLSAGDPSPTLGSINLVQK